MRIKTLFLACVLTLGWRVVAFADQPARADGALNHAASFREVVQPLFQQHCVKCHGKNEQIEGKVDLFSLENPADLTSRADLLEALISAIDTAVMPPEDEPPLTEMKRRQLLDALKSMLDSAVAAGHRPIRAPLRRMNRFQYNNAVQDLFRLNVEVFPLPERMMRDLSNYFQPQTGKMPPSVKVLSRPLGKFMIIERHLRGVTPFPQDLRAEHGFDNRGDHLTLSPMLLESFLHLSRSIIDSPDFNAKTCGIWSEFFEAPDASDRTTIAATVRHRLTKFLTRAFRRPADEESLDRYVHLVLAHLSSPQNSSLAFDENFVRAMKEAAATAISSPRFFYLFDVPADKEDGPPDDFSMASRLSFFLWGSIPDETLLDLAAQGKLRQPEVLRQQVNRLLSDARLKRFCDSFPAQWLQLERIITSEPDRELFPQFYFGNYRASLHMMLEPLLVFETVLIENQSILQFVDADFSYRSDLLEAWYRDGKQGKPGPPTEVVLRRIPISDRRQGGVITSAAVLTMTSGTHRTKPITRGAWLATVILKDPPAPPPADVPPLAEAPNPDEEKLTLRERFALHRQSPACAGCHARIDPLGFALENYDAAGVWRDRYENGHPVDASGKLFGSRRFDDIVGFKDALLAEKSRFARAFAGHLLSFALGRELSLADSPSLDKISQAVAADDYRMHALIHEVALSDSFRR